MTESGNTSNAMNRSGDGALNLQNSDSPSMILVSASLNGTNYLSWSRSMVIALSAKDKLGFINGKIEKPKVDSENFEKWQRVDCMVISWILNAISKDLVEAFLYATSARELWTEIEQRFGESNGPL